MKWILLPFTLLYYVITAFRNQTYNTGVKKSIRFEVPTISVGNLSVGGTGKTPHIEYLIRLLKDQFQVTTLSRGYRRKTKGFFVADSKSTALQIGDEPMQFFYKFQQDIEVAVGEQRALAIPSILQERPKTNVILLDDAYQHRTVNPHFSILLTDYHRPFYDDWVLPSGRLREPRKGAARSQIVIVTKCPEDLSINQQKDIEKNISSYTQKNTPIFFSTVAYQEIKPVFTESKLNKKVILVTGIAHNDKFIEKVKENHEIVETIPFPDHHQFTEEDCNKILRIYDKYKTQDVSLLTTEKDMMRLIVPSVKEKIMKLPFFYLPIEVRFLRDSSKFNQLIIDTIQHIHDC